ncbi:MAG: UDP-N-acetylmuramate: L-alanyl-gamma-D-glutamyl-meso-diaminopimelate ligase [Flavobacteriales bacterium]|jgi:UDP-N-acetylmuramate: L-alanyl-gamma-D-glutamyl-meso-diaminopimelate ligase
MNVHFIAIGGSAMHNLALALNDKGYLVTGSDDEIFEPSRQRLKDAGLLPAAIGWFPNKIHTELDAVILGMHAREDNPELLEATKRGIPVYSYPEFLFEQTKEKTRVVIGGSHGKTTITAMILHVLNELNIETDFMVGAILDGLKNSVSLQEGTDIAVFEGDEYLSSPLDRRPKFHLYAPHVAVISGIAWDHMNVFPTFDFYVDQFRIFVQKLEAGGTLIYCEADPEVKKLADEFTSIKKISYGVPAHKIADGVTTLQTANGDVPLQIFGQHNLMNMEAARYACEQIDVSSQQFYGAIQSFTGASQRLEKLTERKGFVAYRDFAHAPSKLQATTSATKEQFPERTLVACMELHTFSSLNKEFLYQYEGSMDEADKAVVYFDPRVVEHKKLPMITVEDVKSAFNRDDLIVLTSHTEVAEFLSEQSKENAVWLLMSSGDFGGIDLPTLIA